MVTRLLAAAGVGLTLGFLAAMLLSLTVGTHEAPPLVLVAALSAGAAVLAVLAVRVRDGILFRRLSREREVPLTIEELARTLRDR
jgi:uncharacterized membrane protein YbhN (UPF0104 family)